MPKKLAFDRVLFTCVILLVAFGLVMVYSASAAFARDQAREINPFLAKQTLAAGLGILLMWAAMHMDYRILRKRSVVYSLLGAVFVLLVVVLFAPELNNTRRWLFLGGVSIQPSELAKLAVIPFVAYQIEQKANRDSQRDLVVACGLLLAIVSALILMQPDLGTASLITVATLVMLFLAGTRWRYFLAGALVLLPALWVAVYSVPYRRRRLLTFLDPEQDPLNAGYQANQSLIAVGSGGVTGLGLGESMQKLYFLPHPHSDFIFSIVAEELGLLGGILLLALFGVVLWRGLRAGVRAPDMFGRYLAWGFTSILVLQALIHVSVAVSLVPTKGIPLPFISYGGSSLVVSLTAIGVVLNVSQHA